MDLSGGLIVKKEDIIGLEVREGTYGACSNITIFMKGGEIKRNYFPVQADNFESDLIQLKGVIE